MSRYVFMVLPIIAVVGALTANADTIYVCWDGSGDHVTIQAGIDAASDGDEVVVCDGTYTGTGNKNLDFGGKPITVRSENGADYCIIDCQHDGRGFYFHSGETGDAIVVGFTIQSGFVASTDRGAGVYCRDSSPTISNCTISGNTSNHDGGGICCWSSNSMITNCTISGNTADYGGGIACCSFSSPTITNCTILGNTAVDHGGGVYCWDNSTPTIADSTIIENTADGSGGGVYCYHSSPTIANCILWRDTAPSGPEIAVERSWASSTLTVLYSDVEGGQAAAYIEDGCVLIWGNGNIDADPLFVDPDGPDDDPNTWEDNDYRLAAGSPCIDSGCNCGVPRDSADLDGDGDVDEITPLDLDGEGRFFDDDATDDTGDGWPPIVDMGAYEFGGTGPHPCVGDLDGDRDIDLADLAELLGNYDTLEGMTYVDGDLDCDGDVDLADLAELLGHYGETCP